jgi:hypothetical protein
MDDIIYQLADILGQFPQPPTTSPTKINPQKVELKHLEATSQNFLTPEKKEPRLGSQRNFGTYSPLNKKKLRPDIVYDFRKANSLRNFSQKHKSLPMHTNIAALDFKTNYEPSQNQAVLQVEDPKTPRKDEILSPFSSPMTSFKNVDGTMFQLLLR